MTFYLHTLQIFPRLPVCKKRAQRLNHITHMPSKNVMLNGTRSPTSVAARRIWSRRESWPGNHREVRSPAPVQDKSLEKGRLSSIVSESDEFQGLTDIVLEGRPLLIEQSEFQFTPRVLAKFLPDIEIRNHGVLQRFAVYLQVERPISVCHYYQPPLPAFVNQSKINRTSYHLKRQQLGRRGFRILRTSTISGILKRKISGKIHSHERRRQAHAFRLLARKVLPHFAVRAG
jgi:hypothetical protein